MQTEDREFLRQLQSEAGKERAFKRLIETYQEPLYAHVRRMVGNHDDADDVLQNAFIKAWRFMDTFKGESTLFTWLYRIASNEALNQLRSQKRRATTPLETTQEPQADVHIDGNQIKQALEDALALLPEKQRQVFDLKYFSELKYEEIAKITHTSVGALKASYFHAVKKIQAYIQEKYP